MFVDAAKTFMFIEQINEIKAIRASDFQQRRADLIFNNLVYKSVLIKSKVTVVFAPLTN